MDTSQVILRSIHIGSNCTCSIAIFYSVSYHIHHPISHTSTAAIQKWE